MFAELRAPTLGRQRRSNLFVERHQSDRILLMHHQVRQCRRQTDGVLELRQLLPVGVGHALRQVHQQIAGDVRLGLILLDVVPVGLGVDEPVDVLRIVPLRVAAMLRKLDAEAVKRRRMQPGQKPLDDEPRTQIQPRYRADNFGLEVGFGTAVHQIHRFAKTDSSLRKVSPRRNLKRSYSARSA